MSARTLLDCFEKVGIESSSLKTTTHDNLLELLKAVVLAEEVAQLDQEQMYPVGKSNARTVRWSTVCLSTITPVLPIESLCLSSSLPLKLLAALERILDAGAGECDEENWRT
jgi:hypothetical protein